MGKKKKTGEKSGNQQFSTENNQSSAYVNINDTANSDNNDPLINKLIELMQMDHPRQLAEFYRTFMELRYKYIGFFFKYHEKFMADVNRMLEKVLELTSHHIANVPNTKVLYFGILASIFITIVQNAANDINLSLVDSGYDFFTKWITNCSLSEIDILLEYETLKYFNHKNNPFLQFIQEVMKRSSNEHVICKAFYIVKKLDRNSNIFTFIKDRSFSYHCYNIIFNVAWDYKILSYIPYLNSFNLQHFATLISTNSINTECQMYLSKHNYMSNVVLDKNYLHYDNILAVVSFLNTINIEKTVLKKFLEKIVNNVNYDTLVKLINVEGLGSILLGIIQNQVNVNEVLTVRLIESGSLSPDVVNNIVRKTNFTNIVDLFKHFHTTNIQLVSLEQLKKKISAMHYSSNYNYNYYYNYNYNYTFNFSTVLISEIQKLNASNVVLCKEAKVFLGKWLAENKLYYQTDCFLFLKECKMENIQITKNSFLEDVLKCIVQSYFKNNIGNHTWVRDGLQKIYKDKASFRSSLLIILEEYLSDFSEGNPKDFSKLVEIGEETILNLIFSKKKVLEDMYNRLCLGSYSAKQFYDIFKAEGNRKMLLYAMDYFNICSVNIFEQYENELDDIQMYLQSSKKELQYIFALRVGVEYHLKIIEQAQANFENIPKSRHVNDTNNVKSIIKFINNGMLEKLDASAVKEGNVFEILHQSGFFRFYSLQLYQTDTIDVKNLALLTESIISKINNEIFEKIENNTLRLENLNFVSTLDEKVENQFLGLIKCPPDRIKMILSSIELLKYKRHLKSFNDMVRAYSLTFLENLALPTFEKNIMVTESVEELEKVKRFLGVQVDMSSFQIFEKYVENATLVEFIKNQNIQEEEITYFNSQASGDVFAEEMLQHLISTKKLTNPLLHSLEKKVDLKQFFDEVGSLDINQKTIDSFDQCAINLEKVNDLIKRLRNSTDNIVSDVRDKILTGVLEFNLEKKQITIALENGNKMTEKEFKSCIRGANFQRTTSPELELFSKSSLILESILHSISQLNKMSHVCFVHHTLKIPMKVLTEVSLLDSILISLKNISKDWVEQINRTKLNYFTMKQRLIIVNHIRETNRHCAAELIHLLQSHFNISEENLMNIWKQTQNTFKDESLTDMEDSNIWLDFKTYSQDIQKSATVILQTLQDFCKNLEDSSTVSKSKINDGIETSCIIDISKLTKVQQFYALANILAKKTPYSNLLLGHKESTLIDVETFLLRAINSTNERFVIFQFEKFSSPIRNRIHSVLTSKSRKSSHIICLITDIDLIASMPLKLSSNPVATDISSSNLLLSNIRKLSSTTYGSGKTTYVRNYLKQEHSSIEIPITNSSTTEEVIDDLFYLMQNMRTNRTGVIFFNIYHDVNIEWFNSILTQLLLFGTLASISTGKTVFLSPSNSWEIIVELPDKEIESKLSFVENNSVVPLVPLNATLTVTKETKLVGECIYRLENNKLDKILSHSEINPILLIDSYSLKDEEYNNVIKNSFRKYCGKDGSVFDLHYFVNFMYKRCHYLCENSFVKYNYSTRNLASTYLKHMLQDAKEFFNPSNNMEFYTIYYASDPPIVIPVNVPNMSIFGLASLKQQGSIRQKNDLKHPEVLIELISKCLDVDQRIVVRVLSKHSYILTSHFALQIIKLCERIDIGYPIILEGETGSGKTKCLEVLSDLLQFKGTGRSDVVDKFPDQRSVMAYLCNQYDKHIFSSLWTTFNETESWTSIICAIRFILENEFVPKKIVDDAFEYIEEFMIDIENLQFISQFSTGTESQRVLNVISNYKRERNNLEEGSASVKSLLVKYLTTLLTENGAFFTESITSLLKIEMEHRVIPNIPNNISVIIPSTNSVNLKEHVTKLMNSDQVFERLHECIELGFSTNGIKFLTNLRNCFSAYIYEHPILAVSDEMKALICKESEDLQLVDLENIITTFASIPLHSVFVDILMNNAVGEEEIYQKLSKKLELAKSCENTTTKFIFFVDEMNTSKNMGKMKQLTFDRYWKMYGGILPSNIIWISAINPSNKNYQVNPLPKSMDVRKTIWPDLTEETETDYDFAIIRSNKYISISKLKESQLKSVREFIVSTRKMVKGLLESERNKGTTFSFLSQRDTQRLFSFFNFFYEIFVPELMRPDESSEEKKMYMRVMVSLLCSLGISFYLRFSKENRNTVSEMLTKLMVEKGLGTIKLRGDSSSINIKGFERLIQYAITSLNNKIQIPPAICKNEALTENLFCIVVSIEAKVPLLLLGPPGCSKSLSLQIANNNMRGIHSVNAFMKLLHSVDLFRYQGSKQSSSEEIRKVCEQAKARQKNYNEKKENSYALFYFDEAGVPDSEKESLKELHYYLNNPYFPSVLISNYPLDAAKSNRCVEVLRSPSDSADLYSLAVSILNIDELSLTYEMKDLIQHFCTVFEFIQKDEKFSKYLGLRDFYHFLRYLKRECLDSGRTALPIIPLICSIERNFNGGDSASLNFIIDKFIAHPSFKKETKTTELDTCRTLKMSITDKHRLLQSKDNLNDVNVRYILVIDETFDHSVQRLLVQSEILDISQMHHFNISCLEEDSNEVYQTNIISKICVAMEAGKHIYLANSRNIDGSFYDLFNQYFFKVKEYYYTTISIGAKSEYKKIHPNFQCILHLDKRDLASTPSAFLNRFEKYSLSILDFYNYKLNLLTSQQREIVETMKNKLIEFVDFIGSENIFSKDVSSTIYSLLFCMFTNDQKLAPLRNIFRENNETEYQAVLQSMICKILQLVRPEAVILKYKQLSETFYPKYYFEDLSLLDFEVFIEKLLTNSAQTTRKLITHLSVDPLLSHPDIRARPGFELYDSAYFGSEIQLEEKLRSFLNDSSAGVLAISVLLDGNMNTIDMFRTIFDNLEKEIKPVGKTFILVIYTRTNQFKSSSSGFSLFLNNWDIFYIDNRLSMAEFKLSEFITTSFKGAPEDDSYWKAITRQYLMDNLASYVKRLAFEGEVSINEPFYRTTELKERTKLLVKLFNDCPFLIDGFVSYIYNVSNQKNQNLLINHAEDIINGATSVCLSINLKDSIEKRLDFAFLYFLKLLIRDMTIVLLQKYSKQESLCHFTNQILVQHNFGVDIDIVSTVKLDDIIRIPLSNMNILNELPFSQLLFKDVDNYIRQSEILNQQDSKMLYEDSVTLLDSSKDLLESVLFDSSLYISVGSKVSMKIVTLVKLLLQKLVTNKFNDLSVVNIRKIVLKDSLMIEEFLKMIQYLLENNIFQTHELEVFIQRLSDEQVITSLHGMLLSKAKSIISSNQLGSNIDLWKQVSIWMLDMCKSDIQLNNFWKTILFLLVLDNTTRVNFIENANQNSLQLLDERTTLNDSALLISSEMKAIIHLLDVKVLKHVLNYMIEWFPFDNEMINEEARNSLLHLYVDQLKRDDIPCVTKMLFLQSIGLDYLSEYIENSFSMTGPYLPHYVERQVTGDTILFDLIFSQELLDNREITISGVMNNMIRSPKTCMEKIRQTMFEHLLIEKTAAMFSGKTLVQVLNENLEVSNKLKSLLANENNVNLFLCTLLSSMTKEEIVDSLIEEDSFLSELGLSDLISRIKPLEISSFDLPLIFNAKHNGNEYYIFLKIMVGKYDQTLANELSSWCSTSCSKNVLAERHIRASLILIGYELFFSRRPAIDFPHFDSFISQIQTQLNLTPNEITILRAFYIPSIANKKYNINQEDVLYHDRFPITEDFKIAVNSMAVTFGLGNKSFLYKYLIDIESIHRSFEVCFSTAISGNMDCQSQYTLIQEAHSTAFKPCSLPATLTSDTYNLMQIIYFSCLTFQVHYIPSAFGIYLNSLSSTIPKQGEQSEENLSEDQKVRNFLWRKFDTPLASFKAGKSKDTYARQATSFFIALYDRIGINTEFNCLTNPSKEMENPSNREKLLDALFQTAKNHQEEVVSCQDAYTQNLLDKITCLSEKMKVHSPSFLDVTNKFEMFYADHMRSSGNTLNIGFENILFYIKKSNLFKFSKLLPYCVEFNNWLMNTWNGLILADDLERPVFELIQRYKQVFNKNSHIDSTFLEIVKLWNELLSEASINYQCETDAIRPIDDPKQVSIRMFVDLPAEPSFFGAVLKFLRNLHNNDIPEGTEEIPFNMISLQHYTCFPNISRDTLLRIAILSANNDGDYDWSVVDNDLSTYLGGRKFKISEIPLNNFSLRSIKEENSSNTYESRMEANIEMIKVSFGEEIHPNDKAIIVANLRTFDANQYMKHLDSLYSIYKSLNIDGLYKDLSLRSLVSDADLIDSIYDSNLGLLGSIMQLLFDHFISKEYNYCLILGLREELNEEQQEYATNAMTKLSPNEHETIKVQLDPNYFSISSVSDNMKQDSLLEYVVAVCQSEPNEIRLLRKVVHSSIRVDQFIHLHKLIDSSSIIESKTSKWMIWDDSFESAALSEEVKILDEKKPWFELGNNQPQVVGEVDVLNSLDALNFTNLASIVNNNVTEEELEIIEEPLYKKQPTEDLSLTNSKPVVNQKENNEQSEIRTFFTGKKPANIKQENWNLFINYLEEEEFELESVKLITEKELADLGIKKGPILLFMKFIAELKIE